MLKLRKEPVLTLGVSKNWGKTSCDNTKNYTRQLQGGWEKEKCVLEVLMKIKCKDDVLFWFFLTTFLIHSKQWANNCLCSGKHSSLPSPTTGLFPSETTIC